MQNRLFKRHLLLPVMALTTLLLPVVANAQDDKEKGDKNTPGQLQVNTIYVGDGVTVYKGMNDTELQKKVSLEADNMSVVDAIKKAVEGTGVTVDIAADVPTDKMVTVTMKNVPLSLVLTMLTQEADVSWSFTQKTEGDKKESIVHVAKKRPGIRRTITLPAPPSASAGAINGNVQLQISDAMRTAIAAAGNASGFDFRTFSSSRLPETRVKLDVNKASIRESLKDVLKQANLDYALEDDVPDDIKRTFTFENVPISTALDVICRSVDIGWRVERVGEPAPARKKGEDAGEQKRKLIIHIGKKYSNRRASTFGFNNMDSLDSIPLATSFINDLAQPFNNLAVPAAPEVEIEDAEDSGDV